LLQKYVTFSWDQLTTSFDETNKLLEKNYGYGWTLKGFLLTPNNHSKIDDLNCFVDQYKALLLSV
jgi:hypothetical protein